MLAAFLQQPAVGGMGDGLGHDGGIDDDFVQAAFFDQAGRTSRFDGDVEQDLDTLFSDALSPAAQAGGIMGSSVCSQVSP